MSQATPYPVISGAFWRAYWVTLRPYLFFVSGVSGLVGLALPATLSWPMLAAAFAAFFLTYGLGQALTDVFQTDTDSISSPYRPLTQGLITGRQVAAVSLTGLGLCTVVFMVANPWNLLPCSLGVAGLATYTPLKRRWWGGPPWNSWVVALLPVMGFLCGTPSPREILATPVLGAVCASAFFSYAIFVLLGYFKDISANRATGYRTIPVVFGWRAGVIVSGISGHAAVAASVVVLRYADLLARLTDVAGIVAAVFWVAGVGGLAIAHIWMLRVSREEDSHGPIAWSVRGFILLHLGEAVALRPSLWITAIVFYGAFELALALRPERSQI